MGVCYELVNRTKQERVAFTHVAANKARELAGNPASAAIVAWYLLQNRGDEIGFVSDEEGDWPFASGSAEDSYSWPDVTGQIIDELLRESILEDAGLAWQDLDEPELYVRELRNNWFQYASNSRKP